MDLLRKLIREALSGGVVDLYHFSNVRYDIKLGGYPDQLVLDPAKFSHTEKMRSSVPRVFFYPDTPMHALQDTPSIRQGKLYKTSMPASQIYDMTVDPEGLVVKNEYGYLNQESTMNAIRERYPAAYMEGRFPVVLMFEPVTVHRVDDGEAEMLMQKTA